jgi:SAM-dependent methyltransferase
MEKRILNVGCGNQTYGTDRIDIYKTKTTTKVCDLNRKWPFKDKTFDEVYARCVLEHLTNLQNFVSESYRVLKKGGKLFIRTDYAGYLPTHLFKSHEHNRALEVQYPKGAGFGHSQGEDAHYYLFVQSHLEKLFKKFRNKQFNYVVCGRNRLFNTILKMLPKHLGAMHIEMIAYK